MRVVAGVVPSPSVDDSLGSNPDPAILKSLLPSEFGLGFNSRGSRFDVLSRQWLGAFWQIVGSTPTVILFAPRRKSEPRQIGGRVTRHVVAVVFLSDSN